ncbi:MAG TPA: type II toxin-antitoxin system HicA family toxin [Verrucomicrobiae bacterium]|nr:type II toxin-antitoxin system HicA family toxin [Verrucomicrobiae bacterium]
MKRRDLLRHLHAHGCRLLREGGKHTWYINPLNQQFSAVPRHSEIKRFTARGICNDLGVPLPPQI